MLQRLISSLCHFTCNIALRFSFSIQETGQIIHDIVVQSSHNAAWKSPELWRARKWLKEQETQVHEVNSLSTINTVPQSEAFVARFPCFGPFVAQLLLKDVSLQQLFTKPLDELISMFPQLPPEQLVTR
jgi:hypothetical protein